MFQFSAALTSPKTRAFGAGLMAAAAVAGTLAFATPAAAVEQVFVYSATPTSTQIGTTLEDISAAHPDRSFFGMAPQIVHAKEGTQFSAGEDFTVLAFCIDFYTDTPAGWNDDYTLNTINYQYERGPLTDAELGPDPDAEAKIGRLINYGTLLWNYHVHNEKLEVQIAAIQGAIWQIQTGLTFQFHPFFDPKPQWNTLIQQYADLSIVPAGVTQGEIKALFSGDGGSQAIAYAIRADVPEPATWGLMILGFFGAGSMLRRSRRRISAAG